MKIRHVTLFSLLLLCPACMGQWQTGAKPPLGTQIDWSHPLSRGICGCWLMNEGGGNRVNDLSGNGNTGAITGAVWTSERFGPCLRYDGTSDYVNIPNSSSFTFGESGIDRPFSVVILCNMDDITDSQALLSKYGGTGTREWLLQTSSGLMRWSCHDTGDHYIGRRFALDAGDQGHWLSCVVVYDGSKANSGVQIWVNGLRRDTADNASGVYDGMTASANPIQIGAFLSTTYEFNGLIDSASIYNGALSASEIAQLYREPFAMFQRERPELYVTSGGEPAVGRVQVIFISGIPVWVSLALVAACVLDMKQRRQAA
jgi:hypothetical protein